MLLVIQQVVGIDASHLDAVSGPRSNGSVLCQDTLVLHPCLPFGSGADTCVHLVGHERTAGPSSADQLPQLLQHADDGLRGDQRLCLLLIRTDDGVGLGEHDGKTVILDVPGASKSTKPLNSCAFSISCCIVAVSAMGKDWIAYGGSVPNCCSSICRCKLVDCCRSVSMTHTFFFQ